VKKAKKINKIVDLDNDLSNEDEILIESNTDVFKNIKVGIQKIESVVKKYPNIEIRIVNRSDGSSMDYTIISLIKKELLNSNLKENERVKISLAGSLSFNSYNRNIYIREQYFSMKKIYETEKLIEQIANDIKSYEFSPLESIFAAYLIVTQFKDYKELEKDSGDISYNTSTLSRSIYNILFNDYIVCEGYARFFNKILAYLGIPSSEVIYKLPGGGHALSLTKVYDEKYNVDGYYLFDPTHDNYIKRKNEKNNIHMSLNIPISYFCLSTSEFANANKNISTFNLLYKDISEDDLPSLEKNRIVFNYVSNDSLETSILERCLKTVYTRIYNKEDEYLFGLIDDLLIQRGEKTKKR